MIKKKIQSLYFRAVQALTKDKLISKYQNFDFHKKKLDRYEDKNHPALIFFKSFNLINKNNISKGYKLIENYLKIKKSWNKHKSIKETIKKEIIPECRFIGSFGNYRTVYNYLYNRINILKINQKPQSFVKTHDKINNYYLFSLFKPYLNFKKNSREYYKNINNIFYNKAPLEIALSFEKKYYPWYVAENLINQHRNKNKKLEFDYFYLKKKEIEKGYSFLKKNLSNYKWHVTLQVRTNNYKKKSTDQDFRNSKIENYLSCIRYITSKGGHVFKMGGERLNEDARVKNLIEYENSKFSTPFMNIFLAATSKFVIGTSSGFWTAASFFNRPLLLTNYLPFLDYFSFNKNCIYLPKLILNKHGLPLSPAESYNLLKSGYLTNKQQYRIRGHKIKENSSTQILESVKEMFYLLNERNIKEKNYLIRKNKKFKKKYLNKIYFGKKKLIPLAYFSKQYLKYFTK